MDYLLEIGCEEIPATMVSRGVSDLAGALTTGLAEEALPAEGWTGYGGPRRLAVVLHGLPERQPDRSEHKVGPPAKAAFDADGNPTKAAEGFARRLGITADQLEKVETARGLCVAGTLHTPGRATAEVIAEVVPRALPSLTFRKMMRWGRGEVRFVRAIRSLVSLLDEQVVPFQYAAIGAGKLSFGHRFLATGPLEISSAAAYVESLRAAHVIVVPDERRRVLTEDIAARAAEVGAVADDDPDLLEEVTYLVEQPNVVRGTYDDKYLELPSEVLVTSIKVHQKAFPLWKSDTEPPTLEPGFVAVSNVPDVEGNVTRGYERVLRARLEDARFFWAEDRKRPLAERIPELDRLVLQEKLGSYGAKSLRLVELAPAVAAALGGSSEEIAAAARAGALAKVDLVTEMVGEFPELQGVTGGLYLTAEGATPEVARAVYEHYQPTSFDGPPPATIAGAALSVADKLDTLVGCFGVGLVPTGTRDPLGLRRAAQGIVRTLLARGKGTDLGPLIELAVTCHVEQPGASEAASGVPELVIYLTERVAHAMREAGHPADAIDAVLAIEPLDIVDAQARIEALGAARAGDGFDETFTVFKRVANIAGTVGETDYDRERLGGDEELRLEQVFRDVREAAEDAVATARYGDALERIQAIAGPLHEYFERVLVMDPDPAVRDNRLKLLRAIGHLAARIGDFSRLQMERKGSTT